MVYSSKVRSSGLGLPDVWRLVARSDREEGGPYLDDTSSSVDSTPSWIARTFRLCFVEEQRGRTRGKRWTDLYCAIPK